MKLSDNIYLTVAYSVIARAERNTNHRGSVAVLAEEVNLAIKVEIYELSFCCCLSLQKYGLVVLYNPSITSDYRISD